MTTYPLATLAPTITSAGITAPAYNDILLSLQASYQAIYGSDTYLAADSQDGQWLAIQAEAINDTNQAIIACYNNYSPATAIGAGLSSIVKTNGIQRQLSSNSQVVLTLVGISGTTISNGLVGDNQNFGTQWALPSTVTIPSTGTINVTATSTVPGAVVAAPNTLTTIITPTAGWQTVINPESAAPGAAVETDAALRIRQTNSTANASQTVLQGILGAVSAITGVTLARSYENDTGATDSNGLPAHSFSIVAQGGAVQDIVNAIGLKKSPGTTPFGNTSGIYIDGSGNSNNISYTVPTLLPISVQITVKALTGYTSAIGAEIQSAVSAYINSLGIGSSVFISRLYVPANLFGPFAAPSTPQDTLAYDITSILISVSPTPPTTSDITVAYNQIPNSSASSVVIITS